MLTVKCRKCSMNENCICIPSADECFIRKESYNKAINEFTERLCNKIKSEIDDCADELDWIEKLAEQLKK